jgi:alpha-beta hydrolase superfamily lysophospholipase
LAGWGSLIYSWEIVLKEMTKDFEVYYVETREKGSAIHETEQILSIETLGNDLPFVLNHHNMEENGYIMFGSSLGATVILDSMSRNKINPSLAVLIGPNAEFNAPKLWIWIARITPPVLYYLVKPSVKWYMKKKYINMESDPKQYEKYARSLDEANPSRLRRSALNFSKYKVWDRLSIIHQNVLIFTGSKDVMHGYEDTVKMTESLSICDLVDLETNARTHSIEMVNQLRSFLKEKIHV